MRIAIFGLLAALGVGLSACGYTTGERAAVGAGVGSAVGLGYAASDPYVDPAGAALLGAIGGAAIGAATAPDRYDDRYYYYGTRDRRYYRSHGRHRYYARPLPRRHGLHAFKGHRRKAHHRDRFGKHRDRYRKHRHHRAAERKRFRKHRSAGYTRHHRTWHKRDVRRDRGTSERSRARHGNPARMHDRSRRRELRRDLVDRDLARDDGNRDPYEGYRRPYDVK